MAGGLSTTVEQILVEVAVGELTEVLAVSHTAMTKDALLNGRHRSFRRLD
jgi:hypothetical protein